MYIGELSKQTGFSKDTIRWYEKIGLIQLDKKSRGENNYRNYSSKILARLMTIKQLKSLGFTLKDIETLLKLNEHEMINCNSVSEIYQNRLQVVEEKIRELQNIKSKLLQAGNACSGNCNDVLNSI